MDSGGEKRGNHVLQRRILRSVDGHLAFEAASPGDDEPFHSRECMQAVQIRDCLRRTQP